MKRHQLKAITRALYVVKCTNDKYQDLYSCGAAGGRLGKNGNLHKRFYAHASDRRSLVRTDEGLRFRDRTSPYGARVWALHMVDWTELGVQLAEHALHFRLSSAFPFVSDSCFRAPSDDDVLNILEGLDSDLRSIETAGNSKADEENLTAQLWAVS